LTSWVEVSCFFVIVTLRMTEFVKMETLFNSVIFQKNRYLCREESFLYIYVQVLICTPVFYFLLRANLYIKKNPTFDDFLDRNLTFVHRLR